MISVANWLGRYLHSALQRESSFFYQRLELMMAMCVNLWCRPDYINQKPPHETCLIGLQMPASVLLRGGNISNFFLKFDELQLCRVPTCNVPVHLATSYLYIKYVAHGVDRCARTPSRVIFSPSEALPNPSASQLLILRLVRSKGLYFILNTGASTRILPFT